ncbi:MAG: apolipoprotein N-acyltransferase [Gammaproteobacteria bacterium]|nr:MAG: apolipoprotein N-acyltransferase [Gammaproteobacteria bacterium]
MARRIPPAAHPLWDAAALALGALYPLGFAPFAWRALPPLLLAALWWLLLDASGRRGLWRAGLFGVGAFGVGVSWVHHSLYVFGGAPWAVAAALAAGLVLACAAFPVAAAALWRVAAAGRRPLVSAAAFAAAWVLAEWLRGWLFSGFPWLYLGYAQLDTPLAGYLPVFGVWGASLAAALAGLAALAALRERGGGRWAALGLAAAVLAAGAVLGRIEWTRPAGAPIYAVLVQGAIGQDRKLRPEALGSSLDRYLSLSEGFWQADVMVWPETAVPAFAFQVEPFLDLVEQRLRAAGGRLVTGIFSYDRATGAFHNSLLVLGDAERALYHKQRLVPFGEYLPLRDWLRVFERWIDIPRSDLRPAPGPQGPVPVGGRPVAMGICYEAAYPWIWRAQLPEAEYLLTVSNDAWFGDSLAPHQHLEIARVRAVESGRDLLRATNDGISAAVAADGRVRARSRQFVPEVLETTVQPRRGATPFVRWGALPALGVCLLLLAAARRSPRRPSC